MFSKNFRTGDIMQIIREYENINLNKESKLLGYCYKVITNNSEEFFYEIVKKDNVAYIKYDNPDYLEAIVEEFRKGYEYVNIFRSYDDSFYAEYDKVHTFKLPIDIIQVSEMIINEDRITELEGIIDPNNIHLSVQIINDEYVLLGDHNILYTLKLIGERMVNVFINTTLDKQVIELLNLLIYVLKENNITSISKCVLNKPNDYFEQANLYINLFNEI